jgi:hypothetical protein
MHQRNQRGSILAHNSAASKRVTLKQSPVPSIASGPDTAMQ